MRKKSEGFERLTKLIEFHSEGGDLESGRDWLVGEYELRYSEGEANVDIARSMGVPWFVLHRWLVENVPEALENAKAARTEAKIDHIEREMECADETTIAVVKAQADFALKLGGKRYRKEYGETVKLENSTVVTVDVRGLLESRSQRIGQSGNNIIEGEVIIPMVVNNSEVEI